VSPRKAAKSMPYRVWSWWDGAWWMVDHHTDRIHMIASAQRRQAFVRSRGINPDGRFVATGPGQAPDDIPDHPEN
jgi:hypothetical protein